MIWTDHYRQTRYYEIEGDPQAIYDRLWVTLVKIRKKRSWFAGRVVHAAGLRCLTDGRWEITIEVIRDEKRLEVLWREVDQTVQELKKRRRDEQEKSADLGSF